MSLENGSSIQVHPFWCLCGQCFTTRPNLLRRHNGPGSVLKCNPTVPGRRVSLSRELRMDTKCSFNSGRRTGDNWAAPSPLPRMKRFREYLWTTFGCNSAQSVLTERVLLGTDPVQVAEKQKARKPPPSGLATSHVIIGVRIALRSSWQTLLVFSTNEGFVQQSSSSTAASLSWPLTEMGEDFLSCGHVASAVSLACYPWLTSQLVPHWLLAIFGTSQLAEW